MVQKQRAWQFIQAHRISSMAIGHAVVMTTLIAAVLIYAFGSPLIGVFAQVNCAAGDTPYSVVAGDTLSSIASRHQMSWQYLAQHNNIADANTIYADQTVCLPGKTSVGSADQQSQQMQLPVQGANTQPDHMVPIRGTGNYFPHGQCTWWANQRYYQLHGTYVPWTTNSDAWHWTAQAEYFHWNVSSQPTIGAIVDLQPWVQGAYQLGHVAVVEKILPDGHVLASNMNWGGNSNIVYVNFVPGAGVTFIHS